MQDQENFDNWNKSVDMADGKDRQSNKSDRQAMASKREKQIERLEVLEELAGVGFHNAYGTMNKAKFVENVQRMGLDQMRELAVRVGVVPTTRETQLRNALIDNFEQYIASERTKVRGPRRSPNKTHPAIKKLEDEGLLDT